MFNVARNPVTNRHGMLIRLCRHHVNRIMACQRVRYATVTVALPQGHIPALLLCHKMLWIRPMPLLQINAGTDGALSRDPRHPVCAARIAQGTGPIIVMVHGFKFAPGQGDDCPHRHILSLSPQVRHRKALSWPRALGLHPGDPLCAIAFGWQGLGNVRQAWDNADRAGHALAALTCMLRQIAPHRPVHALAHSMGARVVMSALAHMPAPALSRAVLLNPATYQSHARQALSQPAATLTEVINITTRENDLFDLLLECAIRPPCRSDHSLGAGLPGQRNLITLQLDDPRCLQALAGLGYRIAPAQTRICHWSTYLRPGVFDLYRALLLTPDALPFTWLRHAVPPDQQPRWSRLAPPAAVARLWPRRKTATPLRGTPA